VRPGTVSPALFLGFAVAAVGGPFALLALLPGAAGTGVGSAWLVVLLALLLFAAPLAVWLDFSRTVVTPGGLSAFVAAAAGRRAAVVHGWIWAVSYFLYLPYTITYVVYDVLPPVFPGLAPYRGALELVLPVALVAAVLAPRRPLLAAVALVAAAQLAGLAATSGVVLAHVAPAPAAASADATVRGAAGVALLFVCLSLPLYLGGEVAGGSRTVRHGLAGAFVVVGALLLVTSLPLGRVPVPLRNADVPAAAIAQAYGGRALGVAAGVLTAVSVLALVVAEYLALARLLHWLHGVAVGSWLRLIAIPFIAADAISLVDPERFYADLLKPSLVALFTSQAVVFLVYPRFRRTPGAAAVAAVGCALAAYGLYSTFG
jgi:amino acid transporter